MGFMFGILRTKKVESRTPETYDAWITTGAGNFDALCGLPHDPITIYFDEEGVYWDEPEGGSLVSGYFRLNGERYQILGGLPSGGAIPC